MRYRCCPWFVVVMFACCVFRGCCCLFTFGPPAAAAAVTAATAAAALLVLCTCCCCCFCCCCCCRCCCFCRGGGDRSCSLLMFMFPLCIAVSRISPSSTRPSTRRTTQAPPIVGLLRPLESLLVDSVEAGHRRSGLQKGTGPCRLEDVHVQVNLQKGLRPGGFFAPSFSLSPKKTAGAPGRKSPGVFVLFLGKIAPLPLRTPRGDPLTARF